MRRLLMLLLVVALITGAFALTAVPASADPATVVNRPDGVGCNLSAGGVVHPGLRHSSVDHDGDGAIDSLSCHGTWELAPPSDAIVTQGSVTIAIKVFVKQAFCRADGIGTIDNNDIVVTGFSLFNHLMPSTKCNSARESWFDSHSEGKYCSDKRVTRSSISTCCATFTSE